MWKCCRHFVNVCVYARDTSKKWMIIYYNTDFKYCVIITFRICTRIFIDCTIMTNWRMKMMEVGPLFDTWSPNFLHFHFSVYITLYIIMYLCFISCLLHVFYISSRICCTRIINIYFADYHRCIKIKIHCLIPSRILQRIVSFV